MAVTETLQLQGVAEFAGGLQSAAGAVDLLTSAQKRQQTARKQLTEAEKAARSVARERRRQRREALAQQRAQQRQLRSLAQAVVGYATVQQAVLAVVTKVTAAMGRMFFGFAQTNNENAKLARGLGVGAGQLAQFQFQLDRVTVGGVDASRVLGAVQEKLDDAAQGGSSSAAAFRRMGVEIRDSQGNLRGAVDVIQDMRRAFRDTIPEQERMGLASDVFGQRQARLVIPALIATQDELNAADAAFRRLGGTMFASTEDAEAQEDSIGDLKLAWEGLTQTIGQGFSPVIRAVANEAAESISNIAYWTGRLIGVTDEAGAAYASQRTEAEQLASMERQRAALLAQMAEGPAEAITNEQSILLNYLDQQIGAIEQQRQQAADLARKAEEAAEAARIKAQQVAEENRQREETARLVRATETAIRGLGQTEAQIAADRLEADIQQIRTADLLRIIDSEEAQRRIDRLRKEAAAQADLTSRKEQEAEAVMAALEGVGVKEEEMHRQRIARMQELFATAVALGEISKEEAAARLQRFSEESSVHVEQAAQQSESTVGDAVASMDTLVGAVGELSSAISGQQDTAIQKGLKLTQTMIKAAGQVITSILSITTTSLAANEVVKNKTTGDMIQIAATAATPATLTATATSGGAAIAAVAAIIGAVGAIAGIASALAPIGATPEFISRLPSIDSQGHRLIGVKPTETVLDPTSTRAQAGLLRVAAETLRTRNAEAARFGSSAGGGGGTVNVYIGDEQLRPLVVDALDESGRFLGAA